MRSAKPIHLPLSVVLQMNRKPALSRGRLLWRRLLYAMRPVLFVALVATGVVRLAVADNPSAPANPVADSTVAPRSPIVGSVAAQPVPDDANDSDPEPAPSKEVAELYKQIQDLRTKEIAQRSTPP
jgi:hypothetical protein